MTEVRQERAGDRDGVRRVNELAFAPSAGEADLVDALRGSASWLPELSLVAVDGDEIVGHALFTEAHLDTGPAVLTLAPMAVLPHRQRAGLGTALITTGLDRAACTDFPLVTVLGHPEYYPRFGFQPAEDYGIVSPLPAPAEAWMVYPLPAYRSGIRGEVVYPPEFDPL